MNEERKTAQDVRKTAQDEFNKACKPLMEYLENKKNPHLEVRVSSTFSELLEWKMGTV